MREKRLVIGCEELAARTKELGLKISNDYNGRSLVVVGILNGAFIFLADLVRSVSIPHEIDFIRVASYGGNASSSGIIRLGTDVELDVTGKDVLLVEDIIDTGTTIAWLREHFSTRAAASVRVCALIDKQERREKEVLVDYQGFCIKEGFLVGYGLDFAEQYRYLPEIYSLS